MDWRGVWRGIVPKRMIKPDVKDEISFHIEGRIRELVDRGWLEDAAKALEAVEATVPPEAAGFHAALHSGALDYRPDLTSEGSVPLVQSLIDLGLRSAAVIAAEDSGGTTWPWKRTGAHWHSTPTTCPRTTISD